MLNIKRIAEKTVQLLSQQFPVVTLLGPRQVGKTTLALQIARSIKKDTIRFDLEKPSDYDKMDNAEMLLAGLSDKCVIIDEIQLRPELFSLLRPLVDEKRVPQRFILLGSAKPIIIKAMSESLAGRVA